MFKLIKTLPLLFIKYINHSRKYARVKSLFLVHPMNFPDCYVGDIQSHTPSQVNLIYFIHTLHTTLQQSGRFVLSMGLTTYIVDRKYMVGPTVLHMESVQFSIVNCANKRV